MSVVGDILAALKTAIQLDERVKAMAGNVAALAREVRDLDRRLIRIETVMEIGLRGAPPAPPGPRAIEHRPPEE